MTTRILHVSDTHLGLRQYRSPIRRDDFAAAFKQVINIATGDHPEHDIDPVDAVIHTGDLFDDQTTRLEDVYECQETLRKLSNAGIPFYGIIGNHERKLHTQFMDLYEGNDLAIRLDQTPTMVNDEVALYGVDAVRDKSWETADFTLSPPDVEDAYKIVCLHQLFSPPIDDPFIAQYELEPVIDRFGLDVDALALGDYHVRCGAQIGDVKAFYAGSTERCSRKELAPRSVDLLTIDTSAVESLERRKLELTTRPFNVIEIEFGRDDGYEYVKQRIEEHLPLTDSVAIALLQGETAPVTKQQIHELLRSKGAVVTRVEDQRSLTDFDVTDAPAKSDIKDMDTAVNEALADLSLSREASAIEDIVRDTNDIAQSNVQGEVSQFISAAETARFEEDEDEQ
jgi:DNA repair exonuclease SbcCD nuclease subunit